VSADVGGKERLTMALIPIPSVAVDVTCDLFDGRPRSIHMGADRLNVVRLARVRQETAAYPAAVGPRTVFEVDTPEARLALAFGHRTRRWSVEAMDPDPWP
jgi:hypothetical protein